MLTRNKIILHIAKQHGVPKYLAEDICDNLEYEIANYLDGDHYEESLEKVIENYVELPKYETEEIVNALLY